MDIYLEDDNTVVTSHGNIKITHTIPDRMRGAAGPAQNAMYPVPYFGDWEEFQKNLKDPDYISLSGYVADLEREIRLRPASVLRALRKGLGFGFGEKEARMMDKEARMMDKEAWMPGEVCTIQCSGLCAALRELREQRAATRRRLALRKKTTRDASI